MEENEPKPLWWRKKRWRAAGLLWLFIVYPASQAPLQYAHGRGWVGHRLLRAYSWPLATAQRLANHASVSYDLLLQSCWQAGLKERLAAEGAEATADPSINRTHWTPPKAAQ